MARRAWIGLTAAVAVACGTAYALRADEAGVVAEKGHVSSTDAKLADAAGEMAGAARHFLASLSDEQKAKATFEWKDDERLNWHFIPRARRGLPMKEMKPAQLRLANALLATGLSQRGFVAAETIMSLEQILLDTEKGSGPTRDPEMYFVSIFGEPKDDATWGWRVEGHHLSLNFTVVSGRVAVGAPSFYGTNPHVVRQGPRAGLRVLDKEEDLGLALVKSLDGDRLKKAIIAEQAFPDIITMASRKVEREKLTPDGLAAKEMTETQQTALIRLVVAYAQRNRPELANKDLERIEKAGWEKVNFAWAGKTEAGQPSYYRVMGPTFLLEYDNTQNNANHVHSVWRDLENDFGEDLLKRHYEQSRGDAEHGHVRK